MATATALLSGGAFLRADSSATPHDQAAQKTEVTVVTVEEAKKLLAQKDAPTVIDIRSAKEFKEGHLAGAKRIDYRSRRFRKDLAKLDPNQAYLMYCWSGWRSTRSLPIFKELGFRKIYHLDCGMQGWEKEKGETVKGN